MKPKSISQDLLIISILTLLTVFTWLGTDIYRLSLKKSLPPVSEEQWAPLPSHFDTQILDQLEKR